MTPKTKLNAGVAVLTAVRLAFALLIFREFFYFRMVNVACVYIFYLLADSTEEALVFHGAPWNKMRMIFAYIIEIIMIFAVTSGIVLRLPIYYFAENLSHGTHDLLFLWLEITLAVALCVAIFGHAVREEWGASQYLLFRLSFLIYCFFCIPLWAVLALLIPILALVGIEGQKHAWKIKEIRKKDIRFRHPDPAVPPYQKQHKPPLD